MAVGVSVPLEEYLATTYHPDCDYLEGELEERNVGIHDHARLQYVLASYFAVREADWQIRGATEQRIRVKPRRYRIPDLCILLGRHRRPPVLEEPPFLCIDILSPDDRLPRVQSRVQDFLDFGVAFVWVIDPETRWACIDTRTGDRVVTDGMVRTAGPELMCRLRSFGPGWISYSFGAQASASL